MVLSIPPRLHPLTVLQRKLLMDEQHRIIVTPSGRRSRKTLIGSRKTLIRALRHSDHRLFEAAPTRAQAKAIFWERLKRDTHEFQAKPPNETDLFVTLLNRTEIHVVGLDRPERIEGQPWNGMHVTEFADIRKPNTWASNLRPLLSDTRGWAYLDGVPEGRGEWYDLNLYACGGALPKTQAGIGAYMESPRDSEWAYYHWFSADVLDAAEIESVKRSLDPMTFAQEYEGSFEGGEGLAYHAHGPENLKPMELDPAKTLHVGMDFNFNPMCSTVAQEHAIGDRVVPHVLESFAFRNCNTTAACERIIDHFGPKFNYVIYPDPACQNRSPHGEGGKTDLALIRQAFAGIDGNVQIHYRKAHPKRKDRLNAVNARLHNAAGEVGLYVDPRCRALINDFQKVTREEFLNGEFSDPSLGHPSDALGYYLEYRFPITGGAVNLDDYSL